MQIELKFSPTQIDSNWEFPQLQIVNSEQGWFDICSFAEGLSSSSVLSVITAANVSVEVTWRWAKLREIFNDKNIRGVYENIKRRLKNVASRSAIQNNKVINEISQRWHKKKRAESILLTISLCF